MGTPTPFGRAYVLRTTIKHMRKSVDYSIHKTFERIPEFENNREVSEEIFKTLSALHAMKKLVDEFQLSNKQIIEGN